MECSHSSH